MEDSLAKIIGDERVHGEKKANHTAKTALLLLLLFTWHFLENCILEKNIYLKKEEWNEDRFFTQVQVTVTAYIHMITRTSRLQNAVTVQ